MTTPKAESLLEADVPILREAVRLLGVPAARAYEAIDRIEASIRIAAQEAADWETLEEWTRNHASRDAYLVVTPSGYTMTVTIDDGVSRIQEHDGNTRQAVLHEAATWVRSQP